MQTVSFDSRAGTRKGSTNEKRRSLNDMTVSAQGQQTQQALVLQVATRNELCADRGIACSNAICCRCWRMRESDHALCALSVRLLCAAYVVTGVRNFSAVSGSAGSCCSRRQLPATFLFGKLPTSTAAAYAPERLTRAFFIKLLIQ